MSFYHISTSLNRQKPIINTHESRKIKRKLARTKAYTQLSAPKNHIIRPVYAEDDRVVGYISVTPAEWASTLIL